MDTLTHALLGGLVVRSITPLKGWSGVDSRTATLVAGLAAAFPDIDYLSFWIDPLLFLADWHRGPTHSLLMAPVWALMLSILFARLFRLTAGWRCLYGITLLALFSHIASDIITAFGTQIWWPVSDYRLALSTTFFIDPFFSAIVSAGLAASLMLSHPKASAWAGLLVLGGYLSFQVAFQHQARSIGADFVQANDLEQSTIYVLPQPLSPFNWLIIVTEGDQHHVAQVNLAYIEASLELAKHLGWLGHLWSAYRPPYSDVWEIHHLYGDRRDQSELAKEVWFLESFSKFRQFAKFPVLYRIDQIEQENCFWYTDLRYVLPGLTPPFRYGMCGRGSTDTWSLHRLRRHTRDDRHYLGNSGITKALRSAG